MGFIAWWSTGGADSALVLGSLLLCALASSPVRSGCRICDASVFPYVCHTQPDSRRWQGSDSLLIIFSSGFGPSQTRANNVCHSGSVGLFLMWEVQKYCNVEIKKHTRWSGLTHPSTANQEATVSSSGIFPSEDSYANHRVWAAEENVCQLLHRSLGEPCDIRLLTRNRGQPCKFHGPPIHLHQWQKTANFGSFP